MHWQQGGERKVEKSCIASLEPITRVKRELVHFFCIFGFWGVRSAVQIGLTGFGGTCLTGFRNRPDRLLTQNLHLAPSTQQAEQAGFTREEITRVPVNFP
jgi:hypothetical protein